MSTFNNVEKSIKNICSECCYVNMEIVEKYPKTVEAFMKHGMHCFGCMAARFENIEQGALAHGIVFKLWNSCMDYIYFNSFKLDSKKYTFKI